MICGTEKKIIFGNYLNEKYLAEKSHIPCKLIKWKINIKLYLAAESDGQSPKEEGRWSRPLICDGTFVPGKQRRERKLEIQAGVRDSKVLLQRFQSAAGPTRSGRAFGAAREAKPHCWKGASTPANASR